MDDFSAVSFVILTVLEDLPVEKIQYYWKEIGGVNTVHCSEKTKKFVTSLVVCVCVNASYTGIVVFLFSSE